jgi:hypothetical protein
VRQCTSYSLNDTDTPSSVRLPSALTPSVIKTTTSRAHTLSMVDGVLKVAEEVGRSPAQVALAWLRAQPGTIIPIIGSRRVEQLRDNLGCVDVQLTSEHIQRLSALNQPSLGFPHDFLASPSLRKLIHGETLDQIDLSNRPNVSSSYA